MYIGLHVKYPLLLSDFNKSHMFWTDFQEVYQILRKFLQWEPSYSMHTDRQTDMRSQKSLFVISRTCLKVFPVTFFLKPCGFSPTQQIARIFLTGRYSYITAAQQWTLSGPRKIQSTRRKN
jgi:hypothetical protein